jgi:predicted Zn-dependent protease
LAASLQKLGDPESAIKLLEAAEKENPSDKTIHYRLMRLYSTTGKRAEAEREKTLFHKSRNR